MMVKQRRFREDRDTEFLLLLEWFKLCLTSWRSQCFKKSAWLFEFPLRERPRVSNKLRGTISGLNWRIPPDLTRAADNSLRKPLKVNGTDCRDFMLHRCLRKILSHLMKRSEGGVLSWRANMRDRHDISAYGPIFPSRKGAFVLARSSQTDLNESFWYAHVGSQCWYLELNSSDFSLSRKLINTIKIKYFILIWYNYFCCWIKFHNNLQQGLKR